MPATDWEAQGPDGPRRLAVALLALAVVVGTAVLLRDRHPEQPADPPAQLRVEDAPDAALPPAGRPVPGLGEWQVLPPAPIAGRHSAASLVFGRGVLVWGGRDGEGRARVDGAVYRGDTHEWYPLSDAPLPLDGAQAVGLWARPCPVEPCSGAVIVLGDRAVTGQPTALRVDVRKRESTWRVLAPPPAGRWVWETAVWDGREVLVLEDTAATGDPARLMGYAPRTDAWAERSIAPVSGWSGSRSSSAGALLHLTGLLPRRAHVAITTFDGEGWTDPDPAPVGGYWHPDLAPAPAGGPLVVAGGHHTEGPRSFVWSPGNGWAPLPAVPGSHLRDEQHLARSGGRVIAWTGDRRAGGLVLPRLDATSWEPIAEAPVPGRRDAVVVWMGSGLVVWGGRAGDDVLDDGAVLRLP